MRCSFISSIFVAMLALTASAAPIESGLTHGGAQIAKRQNSTISPLDDDDWLEKFAAGEVPDLTEEETQETINQIKAGFANPNGSNSISPDDPKPSGSERRGIADVIDFIGKNVAQQASSSSFGKRAGTTSDPKEQMSRVLVSALLSTRDNRANSLGRRSLFSSIFRKLIPSIIKIVLGGSSDGDDQQNALAAQEGQFI
ncbi:hypothetical protein DL96DRAFT_1561252 [Flagelloscypha sp. PMI_526]|nr:hypothetical protein DL96DRAFT_1561252 [Flagelloscypha sp. PMI_526]